MLKKWEREETDWFIREYPGGNLQEICNILGRTEGAIKTKASKLGLKKEVKADGSIPYKKWEILYLQEFYATDTTENIATHLGRTPSSVRCMAEKLGLRSSRWWTDDEVKYLLERYFIDSPEETEKILGKNRKAITKKARELGIKTITKGGSLRSSPRQFSNEDIEFILKNCSTMSASEIGVAINRRSGVVEKWCAQNNVKIKNMRKDPESYTDDDLLKMLLDLEVKLGRPILQKDINRKNGFPSIDIYYDRFGGFLSALSLSGASFDVKWNYGKRCVSKSGKTCRSMSELIICNFLDDYKIEYQKDIPYRDLISSVKNKYTMDWLLLDGTVVEFFGLMIDPVYAEKTKKKINICRDNGIKMIEIYGSDLDNLNEIFKEYIE